MIRFLIIFFFSVSMSFAQFSNWEYHGEMRRPVAGADIWQDIDNFYVFGGYSDSLQKNVNWIQKFRVYFDVWKLDSMIVPRYGLVAEKYDSLAYFFGGVSDDASSVNGLERWGLNFVDEAFYSSNKNFNRIFSSGHIIGENLYIIGGNPQPGTISDTLPYIIEYNLISDTVTYQSDSLFINEDLPEQQMSEVIGDDIFIFGGVTNGISQDIYKFNIVDKSLTKLDIGLLEPRAGGRAVIGIDPSVIYIIGGYNENLEALNNVEVFRYFSENDYYIENSSPIQDARYHFMTAYLDEYIYILGGFDADGKVVKTIERYYGQETTTDAEQVIIIPSDFKLYQNYPNPFNPTTTIKYQIPNQVQDDNSTVIASSEATKQSNVETHGHASVRLVVYDVLGREVAALVNQIQKPGTYEINFDASNLPSGIYYYQLKLNSFIQTKKMMLLK